MQLKEVVLQMMTSRDCFAAIKILRENGIKQFRNSGHFGQVDVSGNSIAALGKSAISN